MKRTVRRILSVVLVLAMTLSMGYSAAGQSLAEAQKKKAELEKSLAQAEALIDELSSTQDKAEDKVAELNKELNSISQQISALQQKLTDKNQQILDSQEAVTAAQSEVDRQYADMKKRIQFMYENGQTSMFAVLLTSKSISSFVNMAEYFSEVSEYDRGKVTEYQESVVALENAETTLKQEYTELESLKAEVEQDQAAVSALLENKQSELASINGDLNSAQDQADAYAKEVQAEDEALAAIQAAMAEQQRQEEELRRQQEEQKKQQEELKKQQEANNSENDSGDGDTVDGDNSESQESGGESTGSGSMEFSGIFVWPVPASRRVTSDFGNRDNPLDTGSSEYHKGIDIGAPTGTDVVAAADGTVIISWPSVSAGEFIGISHGNGVVSVYMHNSKRLVAVGDKVKAGQVIAKVGSTGYSTGPHLHFGVSENGTYVNPWNYLK